MNRQREFLIYKLNRDWPVLRRGLHNGRKLNRLSTKQLEAKMRMYNKMISKQTSKYVDWLNDIEMRTA